MWNCRITCRGDSLSSYGAYTSVFNNLIGFIIGSERSARTYIDLIEENRAIFLDASDKPQLMANMASVVEPRELLFLLNHLDTADRLYWAPRPYRRSGEIEKEFLFVSPENDTLACIFCGFKSILPLETKNAPVVGGVTRATGFGLYTDTMVERQRLHESLMNLTVGSARESFERETNNVQERSGDTPERMDVDQNTSHIRTRRLCSSCISANNISTVEITIDGTSSAATVSVGSGANFSVEGRLDATVSVGRWLDGRLSRPNVSEGRWLDGRSSGPNVSEGRWLNGRLSRPNVSEGRWLDGRSSGPTVSIGGGGGGGGDLNQTTPTAGGNDNSAYSRKRVQFHFEKCPLMWLEKNCVWQNKHSKNEIHEPSKFGNALQVLQRKQSQAFMATEMEWNEFVHLTSDTPVLGACEDTLLKCYRMMMQMKLDKVDRYHGDSREFRRLPLYAVYYDNADTCTPKSRPRVCRPLAYVLKHSPLYGSINSRRTTVPSNFSQSTPVEEEEEEEEEGEEALAARINSERAADLDKEISESKNYLSHVLSPQPIPSPPNNRVTFAIEMETAWRAFNMHGFCVQHRHEPVVGDIYNVLATGAFSMRNKPAGYTIRHRVEVPTTVMLCIYCGYSFDSSLCHPELIDVFYNEHEKKSITTYLLSRSTLPIRDDTVCNNGTIWWNRSPGPNSHLALSPNDIIQPDTGMETSPAAKRRKFVDTNNEKMALWLSASLNSSHSSKCIFRLKKREWSVEWCPVCLVEKTSHEKATFTCGHTACSMCMNDIRITHCPLCKEGTRKHHIEIELK
jgi:hypothetical protein